MASANLPWYVRSAATQSARHAIIVDSPAQRPPTRRHLISDRGIFLDPWARNLIDLDEDKLSAARAEFGTSTIKDTVNEALRRATSDRERRIAAALDVLGGAELDHRVDAWR